MPGNRDSAFQVPLQVEALSISQLDRLPAFYSRTVYENFIACSKPDIIGANHHRAMACVEKFTGGGR